METLELPAAEERDETAAIPVDFAEQEMDRAAFRLWQEASSPNGGAEEDAGEPAAQGASA